MSSWR